MYAITYHHSYDQLILGPIDWRPGYMAAIIQQDLDLDTPPKILQSDRDRVPYDILPNVRVRRVNELKPEINTRIQDYNGPFWNYAGDIANAMYYPVDKPMHVVKNDLKNISASARYEKETSGITVNIDNTDIFISTKRDERKIYFEKLVAIGDEHIVWKFGNNFLDINKSDLQKIVAAIDTHVQNSFNWEINKNKEIDACTSLAELDAIKFD